MFLSICTDVIYTGQQVLVQEGALKAPSAHLDLILGTGKRPAADDLRGLTAGP